MNTILNLSASLPVGPPPAIFIPPKTQESGEARVHERDPAPANSGRQLVIAVSSSVGLGADCHADFDVLLMNTLAGFANCLSARLERELDAAFQRICDFLDFDVARLWCHVTRRGESVALTLPYLRAQKPAVESQAQMESTVKTVPLAIGNDLESRMPWITGEVKGGRSVVFSSLTELPADAECDRQALRELGVCSAAVLPLEVDGAVKGAVAFAQSGEERSWPRPLLERLKLVKQVLNMAIARSSREEELYGEIKRLKNLLEAETEYLKTEIKVQYSHGKIIGRSAAIKRVLHEVEQVAPVDCSVLISGETGTGKELIARAIHEHSGRKARVMVMVNCAALPSALVESELFGRERGAYTGALTSEVGRFELADGSTIFLDEIGELSLEVQAKLLRILQEGEFQRLGNPKTRKVNVRVIAATNKDLAREVREGRFREDLYYRLRVFPINVPPLRERVEDIVLLASAFVEEFSGRMGKKINRIPRKMLETLERHAWPGNIRELRNILERGVILSSGETLVLPKLCDAAETNSVPTSLADFEREHILKTLEDAGWRVKGPYGAAKRLALNPSTLYSRMVKLGIHRATAGTSASREFASKPGLSWRRGNPAGQSSFLRTA